MKALAQLASTAFIAAAVPSALLFLHAHACGPDWEPEVFVPEHHPASMSPYAGGQLGLVQRSFYHLELVVAYRYLTGEPLSSAEKAVAAPAPEPKFVRRADEPPDWEAENKAREAARPLGRWLAARAKYMAGAPPVISQERTEQRKSGTWVYQADQLNCTDGALLNAADTIEARASTWGAQSAELQQWITGQDAVFANCAKPSGLPLPPQPNWPKLLQQDRSYQMAAAQFYAGNFDDAVREFEAIARDTASPWSRWGEYLAARAVVRKAASVPAANGSDVAVFDSDLLRDARARLVRIAASTSDPQILHAVNDELGYVLVRLDPVARLTQVSTALSKPDPDFRNDVTDLDVLLSQEKPATAATDLVQWIQAMQAPLGPQSAGASGQQWLVARISAAQTADPELLAAAAAVPASSPAYVTVNYHRARLLQTAGKSDDSRAIDTLLLNSIAKDDPATRNAVLGERMPTAHTLHEFLADAPRTALSTESQYSEYLRFRPGQDIDVDYRTKISPMQFDDDAAGYLNTQFPLSLLAESAQSDVLPMHLRQAVASIAWVRAVALQKPEIAARMSRFLPAPIRDAARTYIGSPAMLALLRAPGLRPYIDHGVQRSASYGYLDHWRDNWWCARWSDGVRPGRDEPAATALPPLAFLTAQHRQQAAQEAVRLNALPQGLAWFGPQVLEYVKAHPEDSAAPEILAQLVQATRWSCDAQTGLSRQAFEMLHRRYPTSDWARKTKYYY